MDGAFKGEKAGVGVTVRDHEGEIIASMAYNLSGMTNASQVELMEIWKEILFC